MARRTLLALAVLLCSAAVRQPAAAAEAASPAAAQLGDGRSCYGCIGWCTYGDQCRPPNHTKWYDVAKDIGVQGRGWPTSEMGEKPYTRFPAKAEAYTDNIPEATWRTAQRSAGIKTRFSTAAADVWVHWHLSSQVSGDWLWPATGHAGIDIYIDDDEDTLDARQRWGTSSGNAPMMHQQDAVKDGLYTGLFNIQPRADGQPRTFTIYLPLAVPTVSIEIAAFSAHGAENVPLTVVAPPVNASLPGSERPVLWVGTSIMNGAAANRPGMGWPQQAERLLGMEGVNLGFGGLGRMQPYYAATGLLAEVNASIMVVDCEMNMMGIDPVEVYNRSVIFMKAQRERRPDIPVLFLEGHNHGSAWINEHMRLLHNHTREAYRRAYNTLLADGVKEVYYGRGELKFGGRPTDGPDASFQAQVSTVAGVHPKPLGLRELASFASALIVDVLEGKASDSTAQPTGGVWPPAHNPQPSPSPVPPAPPAPPGVCERKAGGFIGGDVGAVDATSWTDCCAACNAKPACAKWVFVASSSTCKLHSAAAPWAAGPKSNPHVCGQVRHLTEVYLSDEAKEEEHFIQDFLGWSRDADAHAYGPNRDQQLKWTDGQLLGVDGKGWPAAASQNFWQRLPDAAQQVVPGGIWSLSLDTSGIMVRFTSDSPSVAINMQRATVCANDDDVHPTNGKCGFDVHVQDAAIGAPNWRWAATEAGGPGADSGNSTLVMTKLPAGSHNYTVYLPTYATVASLQIGVEPGSTLVPLRLYPADEKPIVLWGSSIAQGCAVTNAGMSWPSNLQRILDTPLLNFGFSGSCQMQPSVAAVLSELKPSVFIMDCLPNMQDAAPDSIFNQTIVILTQLRKALGAEVPIVVLEGHEYTNDWIKVAQGANEAKLCTAQQAAVAQLGKVSNLHYVTRQGKLLGDPAAPADRAIAGESTGGMGVHPSSLAHMHMAEFVAAKLQPIMGW